MVHQRYRDDIETIRPDEQETIDGILRDMTQQTETVERRDGHAVRASHAKSTACVVGELEDAAVDWPTDQSSYLTIATIRLPRQPAYGDDLPSGAQPRRASAAGLGDARASRSIAPCPPCVIARTA